MFTLVLGRTGIKGAYVPFMVEAGKNLSPSKQIGYTCQQSVIASGILLERTEVLYHLCPDRM